jgi:hypothetical protein
MFIENDALFFIISHGNSGLIIEQGAYLCGKYLILEENTDPV